MAVKTRQANTHALYFVTFTCVKWLNLFSATDIYDSIYKWFNYMITRGVYVTGFVIMPNHLHLLLYLSPESPELMKMIGNGKRFLAYEIVKRLEASGKSQLLDFMQREVKASDRKNKKRHEVFQPSYDAKECFSLDFIKQKLQYMHKNPVSKKWSLADSYLDYPHSSARFYSLGEENSWFELKDVRDFL